MLYEIFNDLRQELAGFYGLTVEPDSGTVFNPNPDEIPLRDIQLYNLQFERSIAIAPLILVDFDRLDFTEAYKGVWEAPLTVRFYVVSDSVSMSDGQRHDGDFLRHERICADVIKLFHTAKFTSLARPMTLSAVEQLFDQESWMVRRIEFRSRVRL